MVMALLEKYLYIKKSGLPGAGKGLFTKVFIPKGKRIVEYKGEVLTWKEVEKLPDERNGYVFYITSKHVIDAWRYKGFAHIANDARGIVRLQGVNNNSDFVTEGKRCFIEATRDIPARSEIFVGYGAEYWQVIRQNIRSEQRKLKGHSKKSVVELPHHKASRGRKSTK
jgi:SET domain-containing protein